MMVELFEEAQRLLYTLNPIPLYPRISNSLQACCARPANLQHCYVFISAEHRDYLEINSDAKSFDDFCSTREKPKRNYTRELKVQ